ncbi:MAG: IclR family transcriptional regulator [Actinomycetota bacterium]|nr:IclR family transcriptional regulator [Actinomycetota bacterium]
MSVTGEGTQLLSSVQNALRVLDCFSATDRDLGVSELARRLGVGKSTVHRLCTTLAAGGLLDHNPETGRYRLGLRLYELGALVGVHLDLHEAASPALNDVRNRTGETVQLAVLDGREVVYVERLESSHTVRLFGRVGHRNSAHCTSTGKVLLAYLPEADLDALLDGWVLEARTPYTITDHGALREALAEVRRRGWGENANEVEMGVASVGAPIRDASGAVVAALSVAGPAMRLDGGSLRRFAGVVVEAADAVSRRLGWRGATEWRREVGQGPPPTQR